MDTLNEKATKKKSRPKKLVKVGKTKVKSVSNKTNQRNVVNVVMDALEALDIGNGETTGFVKRCLKDNNKFDSRSQATFIMKLLEKEPADERKRGSPRKIKETVTKETGAEVNESTTTARWRSENGGSTATPGRGEKRTRNRATNVKKNDISLASVPEMEEEVQEKPPKRVKNENAPAKRPRRRPMAVVNTPIPQKTIVCGSTPRETDGQE